jgi:hypothetical protein
MSSWASLASVRHNYDNHTDSDRVGIRYLFNSLNGDIFFHVMSGLITSNILFRLHYPKNAGRRIINSWRNVELTPAGSQSCHAKLFC